MTETKTLEDVLASEGYVKLMKPVPSYVAWYKGDSPYSIRIATKYWKGNYEKARFCFGFRLPISKEQVNQITEMIQKYVVSKNINWVRPIPNNGELILGFSFFYRDADKVLGLMDAVYGEMRKNVAKIVGVEPDSLGHIPAIDAFQMQVEYTFRRLLVPDQNRQ